MTRPLAACLLLALFPLSCAGPKPAPRVVADVVPATSAAPPPPLPEPPRAACTIEGDGEPIDNMAFHQVADLTIAMVRKGAALVKTLGNARYELHGTWSDIGDDGYAQLVLERKGVLRVSGYARLDAVRFRLRKDSPVVSKYVTLEKDALVRVVGLEDDRVRLAADVPFQKPKELRLTVPCADVGYEQAERYTEHGEDPTGNIDEIKLFDGPNGAPVFEGKAGLVFVREGEKKDGFVYIEGHRYRVRLAGWTPAQLVDHQPRGSGYGAGGRSGSSSGRKGRTAVVTKATPLVVRAAGGTTSTIGELAPGAKVTVVGTDAELTEIAIADLAAVDGAILLASAADLQ